MAPSTCFTGTEMDQPSVSAATATDTLPPMRSPPSAIWTASRVAVPLMAVRAMSSVRPPVASVSSHGPPRESAPK